MKMNIYHKKFILVFVLCASLLMGVFAPVEAAPGLPSPSFDTFHAGVLPQQQGDTILLSQLVQGDISLAGPYDSDAVLFGIPSNWRPVGGAQFDMFMTVSFNTTGDTATENTFGPAGTLTVEFNDIVIGVLSLSEIGDSTQHFEIPVEAMTSTRTDGLMDLHFSLNSGWSCYLDENMLVYIRSGSRITLPHEETTPDTSLTRFPFPIYQEYSIFKNSVLVVLPEKPTAAELQSALTVSAGLKNLSSGSLLMDLTTIGRLTPQQVSSENLILIGSAATALSSQTQELQLPMPVKNGRFENGSGGADDGIIQLVNSPWAAGKTLLMISGNTDAGVVKAAQAISTGVLRPNIFPNLSIVDRVQSTPVPVSAPIDQTFADLGYGTTDLREFGVNYAAYQFYIPPGQSVAEDAYLELFYGHSSLLEQDGSGMVVRLNGNPIGSVALTKESAAQAVNRSQISIPQAAVVTGYNILEIRVSLIPQDRCANPDLNGLYANIWPDSNLHLPLTPSIVNPISNYDLVSYPVPFAYNPALDTTAFVLQGNSLPIWKSAFDIAGYLGDASNGPVTTLGVFYADNLPEADRAKYNLIIIGRPSQLPILDELKDFLPAPFADKTDRVIEPQLQVNYRIDPNATVGYIEMLPSPWNKDNIILTALGNNDQGAASAGSYLIEPQSYELAGNFAVISGKQVVTVDTRLTAIAASNPNGGEAGVEVVPPAVDLSPTPPYRPAWILPALAISIALVVVVLLIAAIGAWRRSASNKVSPVEVSPDSETKKHIK